VSRQCETPGCNGLPEWMTPNGTWHCDRCHADSRRIPSPPKVTPRRGNMNKTERTWSYVLKGDTSVRDAYFEAIKFRLANGAWYTPDFYVVYHDGSFGADEVKGFRREAAMVRIKVAAERYPDFHFRLVEKVPKRAGGGWKVTHVKPHGDETFRLM
jgi:hypothetical protein